MVFEDRLATAPDAAVVAFRDQLEEATHSARVTRGTAGGAVAPVSGPVVVQAPGTTTSAIPPAQPAPATTGPAPSQGFEPVDDTVRSEPLP